MFTGIVTDTADVLGEESTPDGVILRVAKPKKWTDLILGESIATNGVCLTVDKIRDNEYDCMVIPETLTVTTFGSGSPKKLNLERSMLTADRFGGHIVQGHVDEVGVVQEIKRNDGYDIWISIKPESAGFLAYKGSIAVNGVSLTVAELREHEFRVAIIPHTLEHTTLGVLEEGDKVNLEFDIIGKYVARLMEVRLDAKS